MNGKKSTWRSFLTSIVTIPFMAVMATASVFGVALALWLLGPPTCGYSLVVEQPSPSGKWMARRQIESCSANALSTDIRLAVTIRKSNAFSMWDKEAVALSRDALSTTPESDAVLLHWKDDRNLELIAKPCVQTEPVLKDGQITNATFSCAGSEKITTPVHGIHVTFVTSP